MAFITLRQANVIPSTGGVVKGSPLSNSEVDNNFANLNIEVNNIGNLNDLETTSNANLVVAINEVKASIIDPVPFSIALG